MQVLKVVAALSAAATLGMFAVNTARADTPTSPWGAQQGETSKGTVADVCTPKPAKPDYPLEQGSPNCCTKPKVWQENFSGGLGGTPKKYYWVCAVIPPAPK